MSINSPCRSFKAFNESLSASFHKGVVISFFCILLVCLISCNPAEPDTCNHVRLIASDLKETKSTTILLLIADDRSGSVHSDRLQPRRMTKSQYENLLQVFIERGFTGQFALRVIGNPEHTGFEETLSFDPVFETKQVATDATLSEKSRLRCLNKCIKDTCDKIQITNRQKVSDYISKVIEPAAIAYTPPKGQDITDINSAFRDIEMRLDGNIKFDKKIVVVMSDGEDSNNSPNLTLRSSSDFDLILIGWPEVKIVKDSNYKRLNNVDQLIDWFKTIK